MSTLEGSRFSANAVRKTVIVGDADEAAHLGDTVALRSPGESLSRLGRYELQRRLGNGAMGVVYLGRDPETGRELAIKTAALAREFDGDELAEARERFFREAQAASRLDHPYIVRIHDCGEESGIGYICMEYVSGRDLSRHVQRGSLLPLERVLSIAARVADVLAYAHRNQIVHRDIKPANVLYEPDSDAVKVADFGVARLANQSRTRTGVVLGTPSYMSPEQLCGSRVDGRSDIFSLGISLYQLVSGHLPFGGDTVAQIMFRIANQPHADIRTHDRALPACVAAIVNRALAKNPEKRFPDAEQMAKALRLCLRNLRGSRGRGRAG